MSFLKNIWRNSSKHKKLSEEWALAKHNKESENEFLDSAEDLANNEDPESVYHLKYLGSTLVENGTNENTTSEAIKTILRVAKANGKKLPKVSVKVSPKGIQITDELNEKNNDVSIFRISYCSADAAHSRVFAFIAANHNETMECHAFLCEKRKQAQNVTLAVARSFSMAYEAWRIAPKTTVAAAAAAAVAATAAVTKTPKVCDEIEQINQLIDLGGDFGAASNMNNKNQWVSFDEDDSRNWRSDDLIY